MHLHAALTRYCTGQVTVRVTRRWFETSEFLMKRKRTFSTQAFTSKRTKMETAQITLLPEEERVSNILLDVAAFINREESLPENGQVVLRFAGGWVRDKLLGIASNDIDVAINVMTGENLGIKLKTYFENEDNVKKHALGPKDLGSFHKIKKNPEKSKHLETTTVKLFGLDLDLVNLRKEVYNDDSRNPQVEFGTPEEDAERRDATINALFYNIHDKVVEDFTGGLKDLKAERITTPMDPEKTFNDDPLRVLRLIRFSSRLGFEIDPDVEKWMGDATVVQNFRTKISRERVGTELTKMLKDKNPVRALELIDRLRLYNTVFTDPTREGPTPDSSHWGIAYNCLETLRRNSTPGSIYEILVRSEDAKFQSWVLAALVPWANIIKTPRVGAKAAENEPYIVDVARRGIAMDSKTCTVASGAFKNRSEITDLKDSIKRGDTWIHERDTVGMMIRSWKADWKLHTLFALLVEADSQSDQYLSDWQNFLDHLEKLELMDVATERYPLTGNDLTKALNQKPGIWVQKALDICMRWQLRNPGNKNISEAIEEVRKQLEELKNYTPAKK
ncbi:hypothetical protein B0O99DRAFT_625062 [Bisporella sp. PMI_857]|nr:hypothetical protein B0O99DRAFT_625062 [Bisporella sp. PMI_857]